MVIPPLLASFPVDSTLTPQTAQARGYMWIMDIVPGLPEGLLNEAARLVREEGGKLGQAIDPVDEDELGLYIPVRNNKPSPEEQGTP